MDAYTLDIEKQPKLIGILRDAGMINDVQFQAFERWYADWGVRCHGTEEDGSPYPSREARRARAARAASKRLDGAIRAIGTLGEKTLLGISLGYAYNSRGETHYFTDLPAGAAEARHHATRVDVLDRLAWHYRQIDGAAR